MFLLSLLLLAFVAGTLVMEAAVFPHKVVRDAFRAGTAYYSKLTQYNDPYATDLWVKARTLAWGVTAHDPRHAQAGFTLYTSGDAPKASLISMDGKVLHEWHRPFSSVWDQSSPVRHPVPDDQIYFCKAQVFPNGDLLAIYEGVGDTPYGYGMAKLDKSSNLVWKNLDNFHHDFDVAGDGRIYGLSQAFRKQPLAGADQFEPPFLEDSLVVLSADGKQLGKISLLDALNKSEFREFLWRVPYYTMEDPLHANGIDYLEGEDARRLAAKIPVAAEGQVLLSFRELAGGSIALLDVGAGKIVWAARGPWLAQHDPDILPNGNIQVFDNRGNFGRGGKSRVVEIDPATNGIIWIYAGDDSRPLQSLIRSSQQPLSNGNVLITESDGSRLVEVTRGGDIVWEFVNPARAGVGGRLASIVGSGQRIDPLVLSADFRAGFRHPLTATLEVPP